MLLTITTTHRPATDLGYLLHKHPARVQSFELPVGVAQVWFPEQSDDRCTFVIMLEVDPVALARRKGQQHGGMPLAQHVNDRPYAASSLLSVALGKVLGTAVAGRCDARPQLAAAVIPLEIHVPTLPSRGGADLARRCFEPLGWRVEVAPLPLDDTVPDWGASDYVDLRLVGDLRLADALHHLLVLLPVLDDAKHYWVSPDEVDKLVRSGAGWLAGHPEREMITRRYLKHQGALARAALDRLAEVDDVVLEPDGSDDGAPPSVDEGRPPLAELRRRAVLEVVAGVPARRVGDLGCGDGRLTERLLADPRTDQVIAADVSSRSLAALERRLHLDEMAPRQRDRLVVLQTALTYRDDRLRGLDVAVLMEVVEHVDPWRLPALERAVFGAAAPQVVVVTTPNAEHNVRYPALGSGGFRHPDHRFEWTRDELLAWAAAVGSAYGYVSSWHGIGPDDDEVGPPTQMIVFTKEAA